jgi:hypothetical protein
MARVKVCKVCNADFNPMRSMQAVCGPRCAIQHSTLTNAQGREKARRKADRKRKEALKTKSDWMKEAQVAFNSYIRARDYGKPCISSGRMMTDSDLLTGSRTDAGHYRSVGAASHLRFNLFNCHGQSVKDNRDLSGNAVEYRIRLIDRIGLERVEALEQSNEPRTFDVEYLKRVKRIFSRRARHYKKIRGLA